MARFGGTNALPLMVGPLNYLIWFGYCIAWLSHFCYIALVGMPIVVVVGRPIVLPHSWQVYAIASLAGLFCCFTLGRPIVLPYLASFSCTLGRPFLLPHLASLFYCLIVGRPIMLPRLASLFCRLAIGMPIALPFWWADLGALHLAGPFYCLFCRPSCCLSL